MREPGESDAARSRFDDDSTMRTIVRTVWNSVPHDRLPSMMVLVPELRLTRKLPASVRHLVEHHFESAADADTLLLLCRGQRDWTAAAVAGELRLDVDQAAEILARLRRRGLLRGESESYRFHPQDASLAEGVAQLAELYPTYRVAIVALIYARPTGPIRDFADAFRLRRED